MFSWAFLCLAQTFFEKFALIFGILEKCLLRVMKGEIITRLCACEGR
jgi:hypothetical protein